MKCFDQDISHIFSNMPLMSKELIISLIGFSGFTIFIYFYLLYISIFMASLVR